MTTTAVSRLRPWVAAPGRAALAVLLLLYPLFPHWFDRYQFVPFLLGLVLLGLPHGAMDHLVVPHVRHTRLSGPFLGAFVAAYLALVLCYLALWRVWPSGALGLFLLLSWLHWGQGDAYFLRAFGGREPWRSRRSLLLIWAVRGALPIILPPLQFPGYFEAFARGVLRWYAPSGSVRLLTPPLQECGVALVAALIGVYLLSAWSDGAGPTRKAFWADAGEIALLFAVFSVVPPVLAVGVYFCVWHSWRHIARLMLTDPASETLLAQGRIGGAAGRAALQSLPMTLGALALLGGLYATLGHRAASAGEWVYLYLSLIAALTFPHFLLVLWMDWKQDMWQTRRAVSDPPVRGTVPRA